MARVQLELIRTLDTSEEADERGNLYVVFETLSDRSIILRISQN